MPRWPRHSEETRGRSPWPGNAPAVHDSIDHLDHPACSWIDQNGPLVDDRVAVAGGNAIFAGHPVIGYSGGRQNHPDPRILAVAIRGTVLAYHVVVKARAFIDPQQPADPACNTAHHATDRATNGPAYGGPFGRATCRAAGNALGLGREGRGEESRDHGYSEFFLHRLFSVLSLEFRAKHRPSLKVPS